MKKLGLFVCALAAMAMSFTACNKDPEKPILDVLPDGMYVIGEAVGVTEMTNAAADLLMCAGVNEKLMDVDKKSFEEAQRDGMYEKYLYLAANKKFSLVLLDGEKQTKFGGALAAAEITTDLGKLNGYWCKLEQNVEMQVPADGFYHIVLDLDKKEDLSAAGGPQIIVAPVSWGISGDMNGWAWTAGVKGGDQKLTTWTWENVNVAAGNKFKFKDENGWKIWLDGETQQVSAHTNLGAEMKQGGADIPVEQGGIYTIVLSWKLGKGAMANSYSMELKKTGDLVLDPATFVVGISGTMNGWADPSGLSLAKLNEGKTKVDDATTKAGTYVYNISSLTFAADAQFKFRANGAWLGLADVEATGVTLSEADGNITGVPEGTYDIEITLKWADGKIASFVAAFAAGVPVETKDIKVVGANIPAGWEKCYIWAWNAGGNLFTMDWPGQELEIKDGKVSYEFKGVVAPISVIFNNGEGGAGNQTENMIDIDKDTEIDITANLKK